MPSIPGPTANTNVRKYPGHEGKLRKMSAGGAPARTTAPEINVMTPAHTAVVADVFIAALASPWRSPAHRIRQAALNASLHSRRPVPRGRGARSTLAG